MGAARVTLREVASRAGVSVSTASRVLDERLPPSRSASAERVRAAAAELGYHRDLSASALRRGGTGTIGVLVPRLSDTVMALMFEALYAEAARSNRFALVSVSGDDPQEELRGAEQLLARRVDGLVLASSRLEDELPRALRERSTPHVLVLRSDGVSPSAVCDDELGGYLATRHLLDLGHRRIGVLPGPQFASTARGRLAGYRRAMAEAGLAVPEAWVRPGGFEYGAGEAGGRELLEADPGLTAVFAANDALALGVMSAARALGRPVPDGLSVVGYNDTVMATAVPVPLTSVRVPFGEVATQALRLLDSGAEPGARTVATPTLIPRASSGPVPASGG